MTELRGYAVWLCSSSALADDLIQETLLKAWVARDRFEPGTNFRAWCMTILRNVFFSYKRRSWRSQPLSEQMISDLASEHMDFGDRLDLLAVRNAMALLPCDQREALLLIGVGGQSYIEAAKLCDCAIGTLKSRVHRARLRLAVLISENQAGFSSDA
ncbi:MAG: sigma-70 family RNA polymerase sigma factor, partial [Hyphomonas sp.]